MLGHPNEEAFTPLFAGSSSFSPVVPGPTPCWWDLPQAGIKAVFCLQSLFHAEDSFPFCLQQPQVLWWGSPVTGLSSSYCSSSVGDFEDLEDLFLAGWSISGKLAAPQLEGTLSFNGAEGGAVLNTFIWEDLKVPHKCDELLSTCL